MNLLDIRKQFVKISGRYDLIDDAVSFSDNGADYYIRSGQRVIEKIVSIPENFANIYLTLSTGEYGLEFQHSCRAIKSVFVNNTTSRYELEKVDLSDLKSTYASTVENTSTGAPVYFALANLNAYETTDKDSLGTFINLTHDETDTKYNYTGIVVVPPVDKDYVVEVSGLFNQFELTNDTDENYWTLEAPEVLLKAALYQLEVFSRGTENAKNWMSALNTELMNLEKDFIEQQVSHVDVMEG